MALSRLSSDSTATDTAAAAHDAVASSAHASLPYGVVGPGRGSTERGVGHGWAENERQNEAA